MVLAICWGAGRGEAQIQVSAVMLWPGGHLSLEEVLEAPLRGGHPGVAEAQNTDLHSILQTEM